MNAGRLAGRWIPAIILAAASFGLWQAAERRDTDVVSLDPVAYEGELATPVLSGRRLPRTLQAPVVDAAIVSVLQDLIEGSPETSCLQVQVGDRLLAPTSRVDLALVPASNQKLLTTYAALLALGDDFRFRTTIRADVGPVDGVIEGNLYFVGSGDPFLTTEEWWTQYDETEARYHTRLEDLADQLAAAGITEITGSVVGDESLFDDVRQGPWAERLILSKQSGPLSALTVNEGFVSWPESYISAFQRSETDNPPVQAASFLIQELGVRGITVGGEAASGLAPAVAVEVAAIESPPLIDLVAHINAYSSNLGAELLLKRLGSDVAGSGTTASGAAVVVETLAGAGIPVEGLRVDDGSGLAESNLLTCRAVAGVLAHAGADSVFAESLAVAGERGTLLLRMVDTPGEGRVFAKTGTLQDATALSGYVQSATDDDVDVIFAYIANANRIGNDEPVLDLQNIFAAALTAYPGRPTVDDLAPLPPVFE